MFIVESKEEKPKRKSPSVGAPKNFLIPIMLLHLREWNTHGYELMEKITKFGVESLDHGNFYRLLRQLEKDNLVTSVWDTSSGGPAKRIYSITEAGEQYLDKWANSLSEYQKLLNQFFNLYNPFYSPSFTSKTETKVAEVTKTITPDTEAIETKPKSSTTKTRSAVKAKATSQPKSKTTRTRKPKTEELLEKQVQS